MGGDGGDHACEVALATLQTIDQGQTQDAGMDPRRPPRRLHLALGGEFGPAVEGVGGGNGRLRCRLVARPRGIAHDLDAAEIDQAAHAGGTGGGDQVAGALGADGPVAVGLVDVRLVRSRGVTGEMEDQGDALQGWPQGGGVFQVRRPAVHPRARPQGPRPLRRAGEDGDAGLAGKQGLDQMAAQLAGGAGHQHG